MVPISLGRKVAINGIIDMNFVRSRHAQTGRRWHQSLSSQHSSQLHMSFGSFLSSLLCHTVQEDPPSRPQSSIGSTDTSSSPEDSVISNVSPPVTGDSQRPTVNTAAVPNASSGETNGMYVL